MSSHLSFPLTDVEGNHQQSHHNNVERSLPHQESSQMSTMVTDTLRFEAFVSNVS